MKIRKLENRDVSAVCDTVSTRLLDSVEASFQLDGISDKWGLLHHFTYARIAYWQRIGEVWVIGENEGMLAGHYRKSENLTASIQLTFEVISNVFCALSKEDKARLISNLKKSAGSENVRWRKQVCKKQNYYYIDLIAIAHTLRGSGAFRQLIEPVIIRMEQEGVPILLDTHDKNNVPLYQHFGFELVQKHLSKHNRNLIQYSMIKRPNAH